MSLDVKQHGENWRIEISNEEWEFSSEEELQEVMSKLMELKKQYGHIEKY